MTGGRLHRAGLALLVCGLGLLTMAWVFGNPRGASPDEPTYYVKSMGTAFGQWLPARLDWPRDTPRRRFEAASFGLFELPSRFAPDPRWGCNRFTTASAACLTAPRSKVDVRSRAPRARESSYVARYPPAVPLALGLAGRLGRTADQALYLGRAASAVLCIALIAIAFGLCPPGWGLVGLLAAVSPMTLFLAGSMSANGVEAAAGAAHAVVIMRLASGDRRHAIWLAYLATGLPLAVARQLGPLWIALDLALLAGLLGLRGASDLLRSQRASDRVALLTVLGAAAATAVWDVAAERAAHPTLEEALRQVRPALSGLRDAPYELVGIFGWLDTWLPVLVYRGTTAIYICVLAGALALGTTRHRVCIAATALVTVLLLGALGVIALLPFGFAIQARYVIPLWAVLMVLCGSVFEARSRSRAWRRTWPGPALRIAATCVAGALALLQVIAWTANSRQSAVGAEGPRNFLRHPEWSPPLGWGTWVLVACVGGLLATIGAIAAAGRELSEP